MLVKDYVLQNQYVSGARKHSHLAGAWRVGLLSAGEAEARAAGAFRLAVDLPLHADCPATVGHARAPFHLVIVLHIEPRHLTPAGAANTLEVYFKEFCSLRQPN